MVTITVPTGAAERLTRLIVEARKPLATGRFTFYAMESLSKLTSIVPSAVEEGVVRILAAALVGTSEELIGETIVALFDAIPKLTTDELAPINLLDMILMHLGNIAAVKLGQNTLDEVRAEMPSLLTELVMWWALKGVKP
jgi:hypothetical protein